MNLFKIGCCRIIAAFLLIPWAPDGNAGQIWHVTANVHVSSTGTDWKNAFNSLQTALGYAKSGDEIWVAHGTYHPDKTDRKVSFNLKRGVAVYGGFSGNENKLTERDYRKNKTILSGNIGGGDKTKNTITIVKGENNAILDGFIIENAYSTAEAKKMHLTPDEIRKNDANDGGGMRNFMVSPTVRNCIFRNNHAAKGGAVYNVQEAKLAQARFINVIFDKNSALMRGGAVSNDLGASPEFINSKFTNNRSDDKGGALYNDFASSPIIVNSLFESNSAASAGAIGNDGGSSPLLLNVTIKNNHASSGMGSGLYQGTGANNNPIAINSRIDNIYNWHEDTVATLNSELPAEHAVPLGKFIFMSNLSPQIPSQRLLLQPRTKIGYQEKYDWAAIQKNALIDSLLKFYAQNGGAIEYRDAYQVPVMTDPASKNSIIYVVPDSNSPLKDGSSWQHALTDLQQAINMAAVNHAPIWLKKGKYYSTADKSLISAFILYDNIEVYGGFSGNETSLQARNIAENPTIVSAVSSRASFVFQHVLYGANNVVLDGLTIQDGNADGFTYNGKGGGLLAYHAGKTFWPHDQAAGFVMTIHNCTFANNFAKEGGAIYAFGKAQLVITNTYFKNNSAIYGGALMDREGNKIDCNNCFFINNHAKKDGGAVYIDYGSHAKFNGTLFDGNSAEHYAGGVLAVSRASQLEETMVDIDNSSFIHNQALSGSNIFNLDQSIVNIKNSIIKDTSYQGVVNIY
ncbi:hypothetical protein RP726_03410 [Candidatus Methylospira mobilis]|uniref:hypothetical protein n=1 Tax=Candidatus Methylospira mobilis TaxID=1808979 RepID=UPI0028E5D82F|nr:hypothetical protein [Candidatus Methylospira mobilis]WNV05470.1 hypothetical protein RP726_03410 [Candidatus Methylospira mobilis]